MKSLRGAALGLVMAMVLGLGACAGGHISLGTSAGACFKALPPAEVAVHDKGKLVGVRRVDSATLRSHLTQNTSLATLPAQDLCVFAFNGTYAPGSVIGADNTKPGQFAVVAVGHAHPTVVAAFVVDQLPTRFRHTH